MAVPDWYPAARPKQVAYSREAGRFAGVPIGWVLHVVVGDGSPYGTFAAARTPMRRFSHLWVGKAGQVEQYAPLSFKSWAMGDGNASYWSVETEGFPTEPLTPEQIHALATWHVWCGAPDAIADHPGQHGIGTHYMGGGPWGGHSCPDPPGREGHGPRSTQRAAILDLARAIRRGQTTSGDDEMPTAAEIVDELLKREDFWHRATTAVWSAGWPTSPGHTEDAGTRLLQAARSLNAPKVDVEAIAAAVVKQLAAAAPTQGLQLPGGIAKAVADEIDTRQRTRLGAAPASS